MEKGAAFILLVSTSTIGFLRLLDWSNQNAAFLLEKLANGLGSSFHSCGVYIGDGFLISNIGRME